MDRFFSIRFGFTSLILALCLVTTAATGQSIRGYADLHAHWFSHFVNGSFNRYHDLAGVYCEDSLTFPYHVAPSDQAACALEGSEFSKGLPNRPKFDEDKDQKAFYEWIKRSWFYGQRLAVVFANYSHAACSNPISGQQRWIYDSRRCSPDVAVEEMVETAKKFVAWVDKYDPDKWVKIAYTPAEARQIMQDGKLAIILGVEVDDPFNCKRYGCTQRQVTQALQHLYAIGIRYFFPIHGIDNGFGGTGFFQEAYGLAKWIYPNNSGFFGLETCTTSDTAFKFWGIEGFGYMDIGIHRGDAGFGAAMKAYYPILPHFPEWHLPSHCNKKGLEPLGEFLVERLMQLGIVIDVDHMSDRSFNDVYNKAMDLSLQMRFGRTTPYPLISGHTSFRDMLPDRSKDFRYMHIAQRNRRLAGEFHKSVTNIQKIVQTGGMIAPILTQRAQRNYSGSYGRFNNNCFDSSKTWAQTYLRALDLMGGQNVALGTDVNGAAPFPGPRFGKNACGEGRINGRWVVAQKAAQQGTVLNYGNVYRTLGKRLDESVTAGRWFNINTDGVAHYGMIPDMLADLENLGMSQSQLDVLWRSAETFVDLWESMQPADKFELAVTGPAYLGVSDRPPIKYLGSLNCPAAGGSLGYDARWWEFEIDATGVTGFDPMSTLSVSEFPLFEACILANKITDPIEIAIPIAPNSLLAAAAYDAHFEVTATDPHTFRTLTKGVQLKVPRPQAAIELVGPPTVEIGDCPAYATQEIESLEREIMATALVKPINYKLKQEIRAVNPSFMDWAFDSFDWTANNPGQSLGTSQNTVVEFCPCHQRPVTLKVEELSGIETAEVTKMISAPELDIQVQETHYDQYGNIILNPLTASEPSAIIEFHITSNAIMPGNGRCRWPEVRWADANALPDPHANEVPLPTPRLQIHGNGCDATLTLWEPGIDSGAQPWAKLVRAVVTMTEGAQCGSTIVNLANDRRLEAEPQDVVVRPVKPLKVKIRPGVNLVEKTIKVNVHSVFDQYEVDATQVTLDAVNIDCPAGTVIGEPDFDSELDSDQSTTTMAPGDKRTASVRLQFIAEDFEGISHKAPMRCSISFFATVAGETDFTHNNSETLEIDVFNRNLPDLIDGVEVMVKPVKSAKARVRGERYGKARRNLTLANLGVIGTSIHYELFTSNCPEDALITPVQNELFLEPGEKANVDVRFEFLPSAYEALSQRSPHRCYVGIAVNAAGDLEPSNNATGFFVDVFVR